MCPIFSTYFYLVCPSPCLISFTFNVSLACLHCHTETKTNEIILENHTFHLIIKSQLLSSFYGSCGKQCYPGKPSIKVIDEDTEHLKIRVTLKRRKAAEVRLARGARLRSTAQGRLASHKSSANQAASDGMHIQNTLFIYRSSQS